MNEALRLARKGRGTTSPNPMVGAVVVRSGRIVGRGYHRRAGGPHAEVFALEEAGPRARGADLYVTLEPCCHQGRTGPCTERIRAAGIARVQAAILDPAPQVNGRGVRILRRAGIPVAVGDGAAEASRLNEAYLLRVALRRPWVDLKMAATLDGKTADARGRSRWITGEEARLRVHELRWGTDAVLVGAGTVRADDPLLTARLGKRTREPLRVVLDGDLRLRVGARVLAAGDPSRVRIFAARGAPAAKRRALETRGAVVRTLPALASGRVSLLRVLRALAAEGVNRVLVEGGSTVAGGFLREGLVDRLHLFLAPKAIGRGKGLFESLGSIPLERALRFSIEETRRAGEDLEIRLVRSE